MVTDRAILADHFPAVSYRTPGSGKLAAEGTVTIEAPIDMRKTVRLRIVFPNGYPKHAPAAYLLGNDFLPRDPRRHFMSNDGACCLYLPGVNDVWDADDPFALGPWLDQVALFVTRQMFYDELGYWPGPEWEHGESAYLQHVRETLADEALVAAFFAHRRRATLPDVPCPCGSANAFVDCHLRVFESLMLQLAGRREVDIKSDSTSQTAQQEREQTVRGRDR